MAFLGGLFGGRRKPNLTPDVSVKTPAQASPGLYYPMSDLAKRRIQAAYTGEETPGVGFGDDFVNKATNPQAERMRQDFQNYTSPFLSNQASARGVGRSILALDQQRRGAQEAQSEIDQLMSKFYVLNETRKKEDEDNGVSLGERLLGQDVSQSNLQASASERLANATAAQQNKFQDQDREMGMKILQAGAVALGGPIGQAAGGGIGGILGSLGLGGVSKAFSPLGEGFNQGLNEMTKPGVMTLDDLQRLDSSSFEAYLDSIFG